MVISNGAVQTTGLGGTLLMTVAFIVVTVATFGLAVAAGLVFALCSETVGWWRKRRAARKGERAS